MLEGTHRIQCHITFTKRAFREAGRLTDRRPMLALLVLMLLASAVVFSFVQIARMAIA